MLLPEMGVASLRPHPQVSQPGLALEAANTMQICINVHVVYTRWPTSKLPVSSDRRRRLDRCGFVQCLRQAGLLFQFLRPLPEPNLAINFTSPPKLFQV